MVLVDKVYPGGELLHGHQPVPILVHLLHDNPQPLLGLLRVFLDEVIRLVDEEHLG